MLRSFRVRDDIHHQKIPILLMKRNIRDILDILVKEKCWNILNIIHGFSDR